MRTSYLAFLGMYLCRICNQEYSEYTPSANNQDPCSTDPCGPNTQCHHIHGSFHCSCQRGYYSESGDRMFTGPSESTCKDYDECRTMKTTCGPSATCYNTLGGFYCLCHPGFARASGETNFTGYGAGCKDVDECLQQPCAPLSICHNSEGSFFCSGTPQSMTSSLRTTPNPFLKCLSDLLKDQTIIDACFNKQSIDPFCSLINSTLTFAKRMCEQPDQTHRKRPRSVTLKDVMSFGNKFVADGSGMESTSVFLEAMESFTVAAALNSPAQELKQPITTTHLDLDVRVIDVRKSPEKVTLQAKENSLDVYLTTMSAKQQSGTAVIGFICYSELRSLQPAELIDGGRRKSYQQRSGVVSVVIKRGQSQQFRETANITMRHQMDLTAEGQTMCVYWNHSGSTSHWSPDGCQIIRSNHTHTTCGCHHLSSFAVLVATNKEWYDEDQTLTLITLVGLSMSIVCLAFALITFLFCVQTKNLIITIHINLSINLLLGELLFLLGVERTSNKVVCGIVAGGLHYLLLAVCAWMCVEGIHIHLLVKNLQRVNNRDVHKVLRCFMYPFGYGVPAVIVVVSAATYSAGYGSAQYCWLSIKKGLIWSFIGPVCAIILFNMVLFTVTLWKLRAQITHLNPEVTKIKNMRMLTFKALAQAFVLGFTWILSLFHFHDSTTVMTYLFTIIHSFQGVCIFLILCVWNSQVKDGFHSFWLRVCRNRKKTSFADSASTSLPLST
ncbi:adhesion G protein-coupled receptor E3-like isoform X2 [Narcine bancroftii]|uniref:adhesion G protein-coupled receptor E3-like isoform X2 n=1 Tax=Narcine bancroftii TaxID=1343680 RepID=UPI003831EA85